MPVPVPSRPEPGTSVRVMVVDDHEVVRRGVVAVLDADPRLTVVAEAGSLAEALRRVPAVRPDVALVDLRLPDGDGIELIRRFAEVAPDVRCVVLTSFDDERAPRAALEAGARGFLLKTVRGTEIADALEAVARGRVLLDDRAVERARHDHHDPLAALTASERQVLDLIGEGMSNREIAERLGVAEKTVKNHVTGLLAKMGFQRRTQAAAWVASRRSASWEAPAD